jgi:hypothetical protein
MKLVTHLFFLAVFFCVVGAGAVWASQPIRINYQAKLSDGSGVPLSGAHVLTFGIYFGGDANTAGSGTLMYSETGNVTATNGVVNHVVGSGTPISGALDDSTFAQDVSYYLQVAVDGALNVVLPKSLVGTAPFAARARVADSAANGVATGQVILSESATAPSGFTATGTRVYNPWILRAPMSALRMAPGLAGTQKRLICAGGYNSGALATAEVFDVETGNWLSTGSLSTARYHHCLTELNGTIYATGGFTAGDVPTNSCEYFVNNNVWAGRASMITPRGMHGAAAYNGQLYVFGGYSSVGNATAFCEVYNPGNNQWSGIASMPAPHSGVGAATVGNRIYIIGNGSFNLEYNVGLNSYTPRAPLPGGTSFRSSVVSDGSKVYVVGSSFPTPDMWIYDPAMDKWELGPSNLVLLNNAGVTVYDGVIYSAGGYVLNTNVSDRRLESWIPPVFFAHRKN